MRIKTANDSRWVPWKRWPGVRNEIQARKQRTNQSTKQCQEKETRRRSLTCSTLTSSLYLPFVGPVARRSQFLWCVLVAVCQIVLDDGPRPSIEEGHLFQASARALIPDAPGQLKDAQAKPLKKRLTGPGIDAQDRDSARGISPWVACMRVRPIHNPCDLLAIGQHVARVIVQMQQSPLVEPQVMQAIL